MRVLPRGDHWGLRFPRTPVRCPRVTVIDGLAADGVRFSGHCARPPRCPPTRACFGSIAPARRAEERLRSPRTFRCSQSACSRMGGTRSRWSDRVPFEKKMGWTGDSSSRRPGTATRRRHVHAKCDRGHRPGPGGLDTADGARTTPVPLRALLRPAHALVHGRRVVNRFPSRAMTVPWTAAWSPSSSTRPGGGDPAPWDARRPCATLPRWPAWMASRATAAGSGRRGLGSDSLNIVTADHGGLDGRRSAPRSSTPRPRPARAAGRGVLRSCGTRPDDGAFQDIATTVLQRIGPGGWRWLDLSPL